QQDDEQTATRRKPSDVVHDEPPQKMRKREMWGATCLVRFRGDNGSAISRQCGSDGGTQGSCLSLTGSRAPVGPASDPRVATPGSNSAGDKETAAFVAPALFHSPS